MRFPPKRVFLSVLDQGVSSVTNVLLSLAVARQAAPELYARFAIAIATVIALLTVTRQSVGAYLVALGGGRSVSRDEHVEGALVVQEAVALMAVLGPVVLLFGAAHSEAAALMVAMAIVSPVVVLQDGLRYYTTSRGRPGAALASDLLWLAVFAVSWALLRGLTHPSFWFVVAWGVGAAAGYALLAHSAKRWPRARALPVWWRQERGVFVRLLGDGIVSALTPIGIVAIIGVGLPLVQSGAYLGATVLFGPVNVLITLFAFVLSTELERVLDRRRAVRVFLAVALVSGVAVGLFALALALLPQAWGAALLGPTWSSARSVLPFRGVETVAAALLAVLYAFWRWARLYHLQLWSRALLAGATLLAAGTASVWFGTARAVAMLCAVVAFAVLLLSVGLGPRQARAYLPGAVDEC